MTGRTGQSQRMHHGSLTGPLALRKRLPHSLPDSAILVLALLFSVPALHAQNPIQTENAKAGTSSWQITNLAQNHEIEGYASLTSVNRGGSIQFFVSTTDPSFTLDIFRLGWYGGLGGRRMQTAVTLPGSVQPTPTADSTTGLIECNWTTSYTLDVPYDANDPTVWTSGVYVALLTGTSSGKQNYMVFVVRDDARSSDYFFQCAVDTYEAYNNWGGKSLYAFNSNGGNPAVKVSFNRPYGSDPLGGYGKDGTGDYIEGWEYDATRFLEREGYDVTYGTDVDVHENPNLLLSHKADLIFGHSEYWSWQMRTNVVAARDAGVSLGVFAANVCYWEIRFESSLITSAPDRTIVGYKDFATSKNAPGPDPDYTSCKKNMPSLCPYVTVRWRDSPVNLPENAFLGVMYTNDPVDGDIVITNASNSLFNTTGLSNNSTLPGLLGYEVDSVFNNGLTPAGTVTLAASPFTVIGSSPPVNGVSNMTIYSVASGAKVFAAGSIQFPWGLDGYSLSPNVLTNYGAQQFTRNLLAAFISDQPPVANAGGPYSGTATISVSFNGTASTDPDGTIAAYQWDFGDGSTGTGSSPTHAYSQSGTYTVTLIVTDNQGGRNETTTTATIAGLSTASLSPTSINFGNQVVGITSASQPVTLTNTGTASMNISTIAASGDFSQTNNCGSTLAVQASCTVNVSFTPSTTGTRSGAVSFTDSAAGSPQQVSLSGNGISSTVTFSPGTLTFGNQRVGTSSASQPVTMTNAGGATLNISSIAVSGDFSETDNCGSHLNSGTGCTINVTFSPTATGSRSGTMTVTDDAADSPQQMVFSGTGIAPAVTFSPTSLSFDGQSVGTSSASQPVTLTNTGTATLNISSVAASGDFSQTSNCVGTLAVQASCTTNVTFTPTASGIRTGAVSVTDDAAGSPQQVSLSGTGVSSAVSLTPGSLTFSSQLVGTSSATQPVTLSNTGTATLNITSITASGDFSQTNDCGANVATEASCTITVTFTPTATGTRTGNISIADNAIGTPQQIGLSGTGIAPAVNLSPSSLSFSPQLAGTTSASRQVTLTNTGTADLTLSSISTDGDFAQTNNCGSLVAAGASCTVNVTFTPTAKGVRVGTLTFTDNAANSPQTVSLSGTGLAPTVKLSPVSLNFGDQLVGTASSSQSVTLTNTGTATLNIASITSSGDYGDTTDCTSTLGVGASCTINVTFTPSAEGVRAGAVTFTDDASDSPQQVSLTGTGVKPAAALSQMSLNFGIQRVGLAGASLPVMLTDPGTATLLINSISGDGDFSQAGDCGSSLAAGSSCTINVTFTPSASGPRKGAILISTNASASPLRIFVTGQGSALGLSPSMLTFGSQAAGTTSAAQIVTAQNFGSAPVNLWSAALGGANSGDFILVNGCPAVLGAGASCQFSVSFHPVASGAKGAQLLVSNDGGGTPGLVPLAGSATALLNSQTTQAIVSSSGDSSPSVNTIFFDVPLKPLPAAAIEPQSGEKRSTPVKKRKVKRHADSSRDR